MLVSTLKYSLAPFLAVIICYNQRSFAMLELKDTRRKEIAKLYDREKRCKYNQRNRLVQGSESL